MLQRGDIYRLDFGSPKGSVQAGMRPALVIQNDVGNRTSPTTIVAAVTARHKKSYPFHVEVSKGDSGLLEDSTVLLEQIQTVPKDRLIEKLGSLQKHNLTEVDRALVHSLGIALPNK
jgi:mRNA interferase MazF